MCGRKITLLLFITCFIFICFPSVLAARNELEYDVMMEIFNSVHKIRMDAEEWNTLGRAAQEQGRMEDAKKCYLKSIEIVAREFNYNEHVGPNYIKSNEELARLHNIGEQGIISIADISVKQGNKEEALKIYDKQCPDGICTSSNLLFNKANLVRSMGDETRYKQLVAKSDQMRQAHNAAEFLLPLPPFITIFGLGAAMMIFCRFSGRKKP